MGRYTEKKLREAVESVNKILATTESTKPELQYKPFRVYGAYGKFSVRQATDPYTAGSGQAYYGSFGWKMGTPREAALYFAEGLAKDGYSYVVSEVFGSLL